MYIKYSARSRFFDPIKQSILDQQKALDNHQTITIQLEPGGYKRKARITINQHDSANFETDWTGHSKRFSARIRALAKMLFSMGYDGVFEVEHDDGLLRVQHVQ